MIKSLQKLQELHRIGNFALAFALAYGIGNRARKNVLRKHVNGNLRKESGDIAVSFVLTASALAHNDNI